MKLIKTLADLIETYEEANEAYNMARARRDNLFQTLVMKLSALPDGARFQESHYLIDDNEFRVVTPPLHKDNVPDAETIRIIYPIPGKAEGDDEE